MPSQSLGRAFDILEYLSVSSRPQTLFEIADATDIHKSTAFRFLSFLALRGYVHRDDATKVYSLGFSSHYLGRHERALELLTERASPYIHDFTKVYDVVCHIGTRVADKVRILEQFDPGRSAIPSRRGSYLDVCRTALGKALLANLPSDHVERLFAQSEIPGQPGLTAQDRAILASELASTQKNGFATTRGDLYPEWGCVAVALVNPAGKSNTAISASVPVSDLRSKEVSLAGQLQKLSDNIRRFVLTGERS